MRILHAGINLCTIRERECWETGDYGHIWWLDNLKDKLKKCREFCGNAFYSAQMDDMQHFRSRLLDCFPAIRVPPRAIYGGSAERAAGDSEVQELCSSLAGKTWQELDGELTRSIVEYLSLMSDEAFVAYLPAFLLAGAEYFEAGDEWVASNTVASLCPPRDEEGMHPFLLRRLRSFSEMQSHLIAEWLIIISRIDSNEYLVDDIKRALHSYWAQWLDSMDAG